MNRLYGLLWRWHFFAALIVIPFVLWQAVTGSLYLWSQWWMDVAHPSLRLVEPATTNLPPSVQIAAALDAASRLASAVDVAGSGGGAESGHHHGGADSPSASRPVTGPALTTPSPAATGPAVESVLLSDNPRRATTVLIQDRRGLTVPIFVNPHTGQALGALSSTQWLPGLTRALHGGWPIKPAGSWLLELGDGWALVMLLTGLYMWWPRGRGLVGALLPRLRSGTRVLLRDLHSCVAAWFSIVLLFFLISALPWTDFWGEHLLPRVEAMLNQQSPTGFSPGGATPSALVQSFPALDQSVDAARARGVKGTLDVRLAPWPNAPVWMTNVHQWPADDRTLLADAHSGRLLGEFANSDIPLIPRLVAVGVHVHQGDLGVANLWLNTVFAIALLWLIGTGVMSWWLRRPSRRLAAPPKTPVRWPPALAVACTVVCIVLPLLGASVLLVFMLDKLFGKPLQRMTAAPD